MRSWLFSSTRIDFSSGTATATDLYSNGNNEVAAAAFDASNHLLFSVPNGARSRTVFDSNGFQAGTLNGIFNPNKSIGEYDWSAIGREVVVVPVPNQCSRYYLFYALSGNFSTVVASAIIDCSNNTVSIAQNSQQVGSDVHNGFAPGLAVGKISPNGGRQLYVTSGGSACSYNLPSGGGIGSRFTITGGGAQTGGSSEAEISPDGNKLAWAESSTSGLYKVYVVNLAIPANPLTVLYTNSNIISGLEFSSGSDKLFIATAIGSNPTTAATLSYYDFNSQLTTLIPLGTNTLGTTQLELGFDGLLYAANTSGELLTINPSTLAVAPSPMTLPITPAPASGPTTKPVTINQVGGVGNSLLYAFPDQIDGENYTTYFGDNTPTVSQILTVDGSLLQKTYVSSVYSCKPLRISTRNANSADINRFDLVINSTDANGIITSTYGKTFTNTALPVDMASLDNGYLANAAHTGYYQVQLIGYNSCHSATVTARMQVSNLTPGSAGYAFNLCTGTGPQAAGTSPASPANLGAYGGGGIDISFSSGDYSSYQVQFLQYAGGVFTPVGGVSDVPKPSGTGLTTISLSYLASQCGLDPTYFQSGHPGFNVLHLLVLTVRNPCATSPQLTGYFQTSSLSCRPAATTTTPDKTPLYPNPLTNSDRGHLRFTLLTEQPVSLVLTDALTGQTRLTVLREAVRAAGAQDITFDTAQLPAGVYLYRLTTADGTTVGRVLKAN